MSAGYPSRQAVCFLGVSVATLLGGCTSGGGDRFTGQASPNSVDEMRIPTSAQVLIQGRGRLDQTFRRDGRMWLFDATAEQTLFTLPVERGQRFTVIPADDRATLDGLDVFGGDMQLRNEHRIYYLRKK